MQRSCGKIDFTYARNRAPAVRRLPLSPMIGSVKRRDRHAIKRQYYELKISYPS